MQPPPVAALVLPPAAFVTSSARATALAAATGPCDIHASGGTPRLAAHGTTGALHGSCAGAGYWRDGHLTGAPTGAAPDGTHAVTGGPHVNDFTSEFVTAVLKNDGTARFPLNGCPSDATGERRAGQRRRGRVHHGWRHHLERCALRARPGAPRVAAPPRAVRAAGAGGCLDVASGTAGARARIRSCQGGAGQTRTRTSPGRPAVNAGPGELCPVPTARPPARPGLCLDVSRASTANGAQSPWARNAGGNQQWGGSRPREEFTTRQPPGTPRRAAAQP